MRDMQLIYASRPFGYDELPNFNQHSNAGTRKQCAKRHHGCPDLPG